MAMNKLSLQRSEARDRGSEINGAGETLSGPIYRSSPLKTHPLFNWVLASVGDCFSPTEAYALRILKAGL
jgi:hypothetical protein